MKVHRALGPGFLESVYANALAIELRDAEIPFSRESHLHVRYQNEVVGEFQTDFLIAERLIIELKAVSTLNPAHEVQLVNYLTATSTPEGLLINFGAKSLEFKKRLRSLPNNSVNSVNSVKKNLLPAFTILELLVAMGVMALLLVLLLNMVNGATKLWRENENRVDSYREARAALGIISRDLQNALVGSTNTNHFLVNASAFSRLPTGVSVTNTDVGGAIFALSALSAKAQESGSNKSDVCQVGYFMAFGKTAATPNAPSDTMNIYRYFLSSDPTFTALTNTALTSPFPTSLALIDRNVELLARNITRFNIRALDLVISTSTNGATVTTNTSLVPFTPTTANRLPNIVEISITAINQDAAKKLGTQSDWTSTNGAAYSNIIKPVEQTFTTRIRLNKP